MNLHCFIQKGVYICTQITATKLLSQKLIKMKTTNVNGTELNIESSNAISNGHGHKKITVELELEGNYKTFSATTNNMPDYDDATDLDGEEKDEAFYNLIAYKIEDEVSEWITEIENAE